VTASSLAERLLTGRFCLPTPGETTAPVPASEKAAPETAGPDSSVAPLGGKEQGDYYRVTARIGAQVAGALACAHKQGILHRDIKPSNLLIGLDGQVWVADFGLAKVVESGDASRSQDLAGTPRFMAPERFDGWSDRRSEVYALGVTLYEMVTLRPAFPARDRAQLIHQILHDDPPSPRRLDPRIPRDLETVIRKAMVREPAERYRSADELAEDLENFLAHRPLRARRSSIPDRAWKWCRRKPALAGLWLVLVLGLAGTSWQWWRAERSLGRTNRMAMGLALDRARTYCERGEPVRGMLHMADLLRIAPSSAPEYEHAIRANLTAWVRRLPRPAAMRQLIAPAGMPWSGTFKYRLRAVTLANKIALVNTMRGIQVWDLEQFEPTGNLLAPDQSTVALALRSDERVAVTTHKDGTVLTWDVATATRLGPPITCRDDVRSSMTGRSQGGSLLSPKGTMAAILFHPEAVRFWDTTTGEPVGESISLSSQMRGAAFSPDDRAFATFGSTMYELWETATGRRLVSRPLEQDAALVSGVAFRPDGRVLATGSPNTRGRRSVRLWDVATGLTIGEPLIHSGTVATLCFSPDGKRLATLDDSGTNRLWDATTGAPISEPFWQRLPPTESCNAFREGREQYFTLDRDGEEYYYIIKWELPHDVAGDPSPGVTLDVQLPMAATRDGRLAVTESNDGTVLVREAASLQPTSLKMRHRDAVLAVAISPDGRTLATGSADATANLWDLRTGRSIGSSLAHRGAVRSVAFRGDGQVMATASDDGMARLWDAATGTEIGPPLPHSGPVEAVAFDDAGSLLTRGSDQMVRRWVLPRAAEGDADRVLFWVQALTGAELTPEGVIRKVPLESRSEHGGSAAWDAIFAARKRGVPLEP
jgi:WD40 repeat protein